MIPTPAGWHRIDIGDDVILLPALEPAPAVIRYRERLRTVLSVEELVAGQLADDPQFQVERIEPAQPFITFEGEHAVTVAVTGALDGRVVQRHLGFVLADDFRARVSTLAIANDQHDRMRILTRALVERVVLRLGARRRCAHHDPMIGWRAHRVGLRTDWVPVEFPSDPSCITVWPAVPGSFASAPPPIPRAPTVMGPWPVRTKRGLRGWTWRSDDAFTDGTARRRDFVLLGDGRYRYALRLDTEPSRHELRRSEFLGVLESLYPQFIVARPRRMSANTGQTSSKKEGA